MEALGEAVEHTVIECMALGVWLELGEADTLIESEMLIGALSVPAALRVGKTTLTDAVWVTDPDPNTVEVGL